MPPSIPGFLLLMALVALGGTARGATATRPAPTANPASSTQAATGLPAAVAVSATSADARASVTEPVPKPIPSVKPAPKPSVAQSLARTTTGQDAGPRIVQAILVEGAVNVKPVDISSRLRTRIGAELTTQSLRDDVKAIWAMGHFDDVNVDLTAIEGGYRVSFVVKERPKVREVQFRNAREFNEKDLKDKVPIQGESFYDPVKAKEGEDKLTAAYREKGYPDAKVKAELVPVEKDQTRSDLVFSVMEGTKMHVRKIFFQGNKVFPENALRKSLKNREASFFFESGLFLKDELEGDKRRLADFYRNEGYQKARVASLEVLPTPKQDKDKVDLKFTIEEGIQYFVRSTSFEGATLVNEKEIVEKLDLPQGGKLSQRRLEEGLARIREIYTTRGYIYANVLPEVVFDDAKGQADVKLRFHEGNIAYIDQVLIRGNEETRDKVIMREVVVKPNQRFDTEKIRRSQERIYNLGFFEDVRIYTEPSLSSGKENLIFEVKERQTGTISLGGGYSSQFGIVGFLQLTKANCFGLGIRISAEWEIGQKRRNLQLDYFDPWFWDTPVSLSLGFWDTDRDLPNTFSQRSTGGSVDFGYRFWESWRASLGYKYQVDDVNALKGIPLPVGVTDEPVTTSSPSLTVSRDTRDNVFDPLSGSMNRLFGQVAGGPMPQWGMKFIGGDTEYYRVIYDGSIFFRAPIKLLPKIEKPCLGLHTRLGRAWGYDDKDVPIFERFFLGGTDSIRGYPERLLGPRDPVTGRPSGGRSMWQLNAEAKWPIIPRIFTIAAPFYDVGNAWSYAPALGSIAEMKNEWRLMAQSAGIGIRFTIPNTIMVIRIDYGWPLAKYAGDYSPTGKLHFNIGNIF